MTPVATDTGTSARAMDAASARLRDILPRRSVCNVARERMLPHRPVMISPHPALGRTSRASHTDNTVHSSNIPGIVPGLNHLGLRRS